MEKLTEKRCVPCEGGVQPFTEAQVKEYLSQLNPSTSSGQGWGVLDTKKIHKKFRFKDFREAIAFVNKVADLAEQEGHHPDIRVFGYKNVEIELSTHAIGGPSPRRSGLRPREGGLSENDFILAAKIEELYI